MAIDQSTLDSLKYHKQQAILANIALLMFFISMVLFTFYRANVENKLTRQFSTVSEYLKNNEEVSKLSLKKAKLEREKKFINGKDSEEKSISINAINSIENQRADLRSRFSDERKNYTYLDYEKGEMEYLFSEYSFFKKICDVKISDKKVDISILPPNSFVSRQQLELAKNFIENEDSEFSINLFCSKIRGIIKSSGEGVTNEEKSNLFNFLQKNSDISRFDPMRVMHNKSECEQMQNIAVGLKEITENSWYPTNVVDDVEEYFNSKDCSFTDKFKDDHKKALEIIKTIDLSLADKLNNSNALYSVDDIDEYYKELKNSLRLKISNYKVDEKKQDERVKDIDDRINKISSQIEQIVNIKPVRESNSILDQFSLFQLLLNSLFVISALTAALTAAYLSRSHSFEIIEIERQLRNAPGSSEKSINPFLKQPKQAIDLKNFIKELSSLLNNNSKLDKSG